MVAWSSSAFSQYVIPSHTGLLTCKGSVFQLYTGCRSAHHRTRLDEDVLVTYSEFLFNDKDASSRSADISSILGSIAIAGASAVCVGSSPLMPVAMACLPLFIPVSITRASDSGMLSFLSDDAKSFVKGITYVSMCQGSLAVADFVFGDLLSGFMKSIFAALGFYVSLSEDGAAVLPSFTVVSFVNGSITLLSAFERMSERRTPLFSGIMPLYLNYIHLSQLVHPILCFAGAYMGWQIIKELRRSGVIGAAVLAADGPMEPRRARVLSSAGASMTGGFEPFTGRGHSLRSMSMATVVNDGPEEQPQQTN